MLKNQKGEMIIGLMAIVFVLVAGWFTVEYQKTDHPKSADQKQTQNAQKPQPEQVKK